MATKKTGTTKTRAKVAAKKTTARRSRAAQAHDDELPPAPAGSTSLVIVESPAKAKTIGKYLGRAYRVRATVGHIMDLPEKKLGIDVEKGVTPELGPTPGHEKTIAELKAGAKVSKEVLIATDPDREGEAIAYHVATQIRPKRKKGIAYTGPSIKRVLFHEITKDAVRKAIQDAGDIDDKKGEGQRG